MSPFAKDLFDLGVEQARQFLPEANAMKVEPRWVAELNAAEDAQAIRDQQKKDAHFDRLSRLSHNGR